MASINVAVSKMINAPATEVYTIIADYQSHHPHILPKVFTDLMVKGSYRNPTLMSGKIFKKTKQLLPK